MREIDITTDLLAKYIAMNYEVKHTKISSLRISALTQLKTITEQHYKELPNVMLINSIFRKKADFIMSATTKKEIAEILKISTPHYNGAEFIVTSPYHVEEEELILWSLTSLKIPLNRYATTRYLELAAKFYPEEVKGICL